MLLLDLTLPTPAENLACDEALLEWREASSARGPALLRFWEPFEPFVVLGYANHAAHEVNLDACRALGIPIYRRCSGGGAVLQMPGCLNYALVLPAETDGPLASIPGANQLIMQRQAAALTRWLAEPVTVAGHTDLVWRDRKFSGNAQRRKRHWLLFHGTFLLNAPLDLIEQCLSMPSRQPAYRRGRGHADFLTSLPLSAEAVKAALRAEWQAEGMSEPPSPASIETLVAQKYGRAEWNLKW
jgi:lipoate-protein ligase A